MNNEIMVEISQILKIHKSNMEKLLNSHDITPMQNAVLVYIFTQKKRFNKNVNQKDIENEFKIKASSVNSLISGLINKELIIKEPSSIDRRVNYLKISNKGTSLLNKGKEIIEYSQKHLFDNISNEEQQALLNILNKIKNNLLQIAN